MEYKNNGLIINKAFMSKNNALKIQYNKNTNQIYIHAGKKDNYKWVWIKSKFSDSEIGEILRVLDGQTDKCSFFHQFNGNTTRTWINKKDGFIFVKIEDISKALNSGEQEVMKVLLEKVILLANIKRTM
jgi:hypothetical protein